MKKIFAFLLVGLVIVACNFAGDDDYEKMADDMCNCWAPINNGISKQGRIAILEAAEKNIDFEKALEEFEVKYPVEAAADREIFLLAQSPEFTKCLADLEKKYSDLYMTGSEAEATEKLIEVLKDKKGCEMLYSFTKLELMQGL